MLSALSRQRASLRLARNAAVLLQQSDAACTQTSAPVIACSLSSWRRGLHASSALWESLTVEAPNMGALRQGRDRACLGWASGLTEPCVAGESITEGTIAALLKQAGDAVDEDEAIAQIETDKVTLDVRAPKAGRLEEYKVGLLSCSALWPQGACSSSARHPAGEGRRHGHCGPGRGRHRRWGGCATLL